jgi:hypothetical protein
VGVDCILFPLGSSLLVLGSGVTASVLGPRWGRPWGFTGWTFSGL